MTLTPAPGHSDAGSGSTVSSRCGLPSATLGERDVHCLQDATKGKS